MDYSQLLTHLARQLNAFANSIKSQRFDESAQSRTKRVQETSAEYMIDAMDDSPELLFLETEIQWLLSIVPTVT